MGEFKIRDKTTGEVFTIREKAPEENARGNQLPDFASVKQALPTVGQILGGIGGGVMGSGVGHPYYGGAIGGVAGRAGGARYAAKPSLAITDLFKMMGVPSGPLGDLSPEQQAAVNKEAASAVIPETAGMLTGGAINKVGSGLVKAFIPRLVAQRGFQEGFKKLLNPEFYKERLPQPFVQRVSNLWDEASNRFGSNVEKSVTRSKARVSLKTIQENFRSSLKKIGLNTTNDIEKLDISRRDKELLQGEITNLYSIAEPATAEMIWKARRGLDKTLFGKSWKPEAEEVLYKLRKSLNEPLKKLPGIKQAFQDYEFVSDAKLLLKKKFEGTVERGTTGEVFSPSIENFVKSLMSEDKGEVRGLLKDIDPDLASIMFDVASAKILGRQTIVQGRPLTDILANIVSPKAVARGASFFQEPSVKAGKAAGGALFKTLLTNFR